jgi:O-antigen/teichoic acid export membrane protein
MRNKMALRNVCINLILQVITLLSGLILPKMFISFYGSAMNGMISSIGQFMLYLGLVESGVGAASIVGLYLPIANKEQDKINGILSATKSFYYRSGMIYVVLVGLLTVLYPMLAQGQIEASITRGMILILAASTLIDFFFLGKYNVLLMADQKSYVISGIQAIGVLLNLIVSVILIRLHADVLLVKGVATGVYMLRFVIVYFYVRKNYPKLRLNVKPNNKPLGQRWSAFLHQIVGMVVNNTDIVLLTFFLGSGSLLEISVYSVYNMVAYSLTTIYNSFSSALGAGFGDMICKGEKEGLKKAYSNFEYIYFILLFTGYTCMGILLYSFVSVYTSGIVDVNYTRISLVILFTLIGLMQNIRIPGLTIICAAGHFRQTQIRAIMEAVINLVVSLILVIPYGMEGVLFGTLCSYAYRSIDVMIYSARRLIHESLVLTVRRVLRNLIIMVTIVLFSTLFQFDQITTFGQWTLTAIMWAVGSFCLYLIVNALIEPAQIKMLLRRVTRHR